MKPETPRKSALVFALGLAVIGLTPGLASAADQNRMNGVPDSTNSTSRTSMDGVPRQGTPMDHGRMDGSHTASGMSKTGNPDYDFAANMKMHHEMGIQMAKSQIQNGKNPEMVKMARAIVTNQTKESTAFEKYLAANKATKPNGLTMSK